MSTRRMHSGLPALQQVPRKPADAVCALRKAFTQSMRPYLLRQDYSKLEGRLAGAKEKA